MRCLPIAIALLLIAPLATAQQIYKWTDAKGTVHYSQAEPPQGTHYQQMKLAGGVESTTAPASQATTESPASSNSAPAPQPVTDTPANRAKMCATLKSNLAMLQGSGPVVMQQYGKAVALSNAQRQQQMASAQAQYQQYCGGN